MIFLTDDELISLTGKKRRASQIEALNIMGYQHSVRPDGHIIVLRAHVEEILGVKPSKNAKILEPNWGFINA